MIIYIILGIMMLLAIFVIVFAFESDDNTVRMLLVIISAIPWIILLLFLYTTGKLYFSMLSAQRYILLLIPHKCF